MAIRLACYWQLDSETEVCFAVKSLPIVTTTRNKESEKKPTSVFAVFQGKCYSAECSLQSRVKYLLRRVSDILAVTVDRNAL